MTDKFSGLYWCLFFVLVFPSFFIILSADCKKRYSEVTDERLNSLAILHLHKHKDVDIDGVVTKFAL